MQSIRILVIAVLFLWSHGSEAQSRFQRALIKLAGREVTELGKLGIAFDHGFHVPRKTFVCEFTPEELKLIQEAGFEYELAPDTDPTIQSSAKPCLPIFEKEYKTPQNYRYGNLGGFLPLKEIYNDLDRMKILYPDLISEYTPIKGVETYEGRDINWVRISDNPDEDETEPEILYTALHHAREPNSAAQMLFFMWYILENYNTDPDIKYLINGTELYFIPVVNPDGYAFNETEFPGGGGEWRKNRFEHDSGFYGVDLNRNYGIGWGHDDSGSSPNPDSETYRGEIPFSEPETKAIRNFCEEHQFKIALNYHTYGNYLIHPWGYLNRQTEDSSLFQVLSGLFTEHNKYKYGLSSETVGYATNGVCDDWMYGDITAKNRIFAFTPEVGFSFWPKKQDIDFLNKSCMPMNLLAAWNVHSYAYLKDNSACNLTEERASFSVNVTRSGLKQNVITLSVTPITSNVKITSLDQAIVLTPGETLPVDFDYEMQGDYEKGDTVMFNVNLKTDALNEHYIIIKIYSGKQDIYDAFSDLSQWQTSGFSLTDETFFSAPYCLTDSPYEDYELPSEYIIECTEEINLFGITDAYLNFWTKWDIYPDFDYAQVRVIKAGGIEEALCGKYTINGKQAFGQPIYANNQSEWVKECISLNDFIGQSIRIKFVLSTSDASLPADGIYIDDMEIHRFNRITSSVDKISEHDFIHKVIPNPVQRNAACYVQIPDNMHIVDLSLMHTINGQIQSVPFSKYGNKIKIQTESLIPGLYNVQLRTTTGHTISSKIIIQ